MKPRAAQSAEARRAAVGAIDRILRREAAAGIFARHLPGLDAQRLDGGRWPDPGTWGWGEPTSRLNRLRLVRGAPLGDGGRQPEGDQRQPQACPARPDLSASASESHHLRPVAGMILAMTQPSQDDLLLVRQLAEESRAFDASGADPERTCWLVVHRHVHGFLPAEYDIREVPEDLYLAVLAERRRGS